MSTVADLMRGKGNDTATIAAEESVLAAAGQMNACRIGALVVTKAGRPCGIITERDIMTRVVAAERSARDTVVDDVMTSPVVTCTDHTTLDELRSVMRQKRIRHVPVTDAEQSLRGMVSIGDLNTAQVEDMTETIEYLEQYMYRG